MRKSYQYTPTDRLVGAKKSDSAKQSTFQMPLASVLPHFDLKIEVPAWLF